MRNYVKLSVALMIIALQPFVARAQKCSDMFSYEKDSFNGLTLNYRKANTNTS